MDALRNVKKEKREDWRKGAEGRKRVKIVRTGNGEPEKYRTDHHRALSKRPGEGSKTALSTFQDEGCSGTDDCRADSAA